MVGALDCKGLGGVCLRGCSCRGFGSECGNLRGCICGGQKGTACGGGVCDVSGGNIPVAYLEPICGCGGAPACDEAEGASSVCLDDDLALSLC